MYCDACGKAMDDTPEENAWHNVHPHPTGNIDTGMCKECVDWSSHIVFDQPIKVVEDNLRGPALDKFMAMPFSTKCWIVTKLVERGALKWQIVPY